MTRTQYKRMKVFALRMVPTAIDGARWRNELREHVAEILYRLEIEEYGIHYSTIKNWDHHEPVPGDDGTCGFAWNHPSRLLCDLVSEYCWDHKLERENEDRHGNCRATETKTGIALACCIRAACDVAVSPSAGVVGWTIGDLKTMWQNRPLPKWVKSFFAGDFDTFKDTDPAWL